MSYSAKRILEIVLSIVIIVCVFLPFCFGITPFVYAFTRMSWFGVIMVSLPLSLIVFLLAIQLIESKLDLGLLKSLKLFFGLLYLIELGFYIYILTDSSENEFQTILIAILHSTVLFSTTIIRKIKANSFVQNTIIATMTLPFIFHFPFLAFRVKDMNFGGWIIEGAFVLLYLIGMYKVIIGRK